VGCAAVSGERVWWGLPVGFCGVWMGEADRDGDFSHFEGCSQETI